MLLQVKKIMRSEWVQTPVFCIGSVMAGYLLSLGTVSGLVSPFAAALAGICSPLYAFCILLGSLGTYAMQEAPEGMQFLLIALACIICIRIFFYDNYKPHILGIMTAISCIAAGIILDLLFRGGEGRLPLYVLESFLTGAAAFFLSDAIQTMQEQKKIALGIGKSFTFAICYMLSITALCGIDFEFCNLGRLLGVTMTLLSAKQFRQSAGTLCGALTACGVVLCSVSLGMPLLFLPVTAMLAGFLYNLPNACLIPVFFIMQILSSAVLDSSIALVKVFVELMIACCLYALCSKIELRYFISLPATNPAGQRQMIEQEKFLSEALRELHDETSAVMRHLTVSQSIDPVQQVREHICVNCQKNTYCWKQNCQQTEKAFQQLLHTPSVPVEILENCLHDKKLKDTMAVYHQRRTLQQMQKVHLLQSRAVTLEYLQLLERVTADAARRRSLQFCEAETSALRNILHRCAVTEESCFVYKLRSGRCAAEVYTKQDEFPAATIQELLSRQMHLQFKSVMYQHKNIYRYCYYQLPAYYLDYAMKSINAPTYERCGDHADAFTDSTGNQYLVISDGMGSGSTASLASRIAVRTFRSMVSCEMPAESAVQLVNAMLMTETSTENFATLDVLCLHADTGELLFYKSGAAATLWQREKDMQKISSKSFPVGIVSDAAPSRHKITAQSDDTVLMLSDGISEAEYPYIKQLLAEQPETQTLVESICEKAAVFHGGECKDDMTVIAARVCRRFAVPSAVRRTKQAQKTMANVK